MAIIGGRVSYDNGWMGFEILSGGFSLKTGGGFR